MRENRTYGLMREGWRKPVLYSTIDFAFISESEPSITIQIISHNPETQERIEEIYQRKISRS